MVLFIINYILNKKIFTKKINFKSLPENSKKACPILNRPGKIGNQKFVKFSLS